MARDPIRTVEAYSIHGHVGAGTEHETLLDYRDFFTQVHAADLRSLRVKLGDDVVAITDKAEDSTHTSLRFVIGSTDELPLVYDLGSATATPIDPGADRLVVRGAWVFVIPGRRLLFIEKKRPGVPVFQIERFLTNFGRTALGLDGLTVSLNPVPSKDFSRDVEEMTRIREATIVMRRPNHSWTKMAGELIGAPAAESNAASVRLQVSADRGQSLEKSQGVVHDLLALAARPINGLKDAIVKGQSPRHEGERTISLERSKVKASKRIRRDASNEDVRDTLGALVNETANAIDDVTQNDGHGDVST